MLADAVRRSGMEPVTNREGSNMTNGLVTTLVAHCDARGSLRVGERAIGIFEIDEGHLLPAIKAVQPRLVLFTNLLRDQLDRYFEIDWTVHLWREALASLPASSTVVLNADDPQIAYLGADLLNPVLYYGLEDPRHALPELEHISDSRRCLRCGTDLDYSHVFYAHLGHYRCPDFGWMRPNPTVSAGKIELAGVDGSHIEAVTPSGAIELELPLGGLYNAYNALAATAVAVNGGLSKAVGSPAAPVPGTIWLSKVTTADTRKGS